MKSGDLVRYVLVWSKPKGKREPPSFHQIKMFDSSIATNFNSGDLGIIISCDSLIKIAHVLFFNRKSVVKVATKNLKLIARG